MCLLEDVIVQKILWSLLLIATMTSVACIQNVTAPPVSTGGNTAPTIVRFAASPTSVFTGGTSNLSWEITNAASASIDHGIGPVALKGNMSVSVSSTTTYTLSANNKYGDSSATAQVIVTGPAPAGNPSTYNLPVVVTFAVSPSNIESGGTALLRWEVQNSFDIDITPGMSIIPTKGSAEVSPPFPTTYKLTARNAQGSIIATTTLTVSGVHPDAETPVIKYFTATPYVIKKGESAILSWESAEASSVSIDKGVGTVDGSGTIRVTPDSTTTYMITAVNPRGGQFQSTTVNVR
jgi:eukaryotic-like serine/threonine-protein kinase